jgi:hypothetical protein
MLKRRLTQVMVAVMIAILAPLATSTPAHAACYTPVTDPWGLALPQTQVNCSPGVVYYWTYDSRRHAFTINPSGQPIHTWRTCSTCAYKSSWVGLGGWASDYYNFINYTGPSGRQALEVSVVGSGGALYCKNYNGNNAGSWFPGATAWTPSLSSCLAF